MTFAELSGDIRGCLTEVDSCFRLLVPFDLGPHRGAAAPAVASGAPGEGPPRPASAPDLGDDEQPCCSKSLPACARCPVATTGASSEDEEEDEDSDQEDFVRSHGLGSHKYTLDVELSSGTRSCRCSELPRGCSPGGCPNQASGQGPQALLTAQACWG